MSAFETLRGALGDRIEGTRPDGLSARCPAHDDGTASLDVTIAPNERDPHFSEKLAKEAPGVLAWALEGCAAWQREGLNPPAEVLTATADYLDAEDTIGAWLAECVERDGSAWTSSADVFASWSVWAQARGEFSGSTKRLSEELTRRGFASVRTRTARGFSALRLLPVTHMTSPAYIDVIRAPAHTHAHAHAPIRANTESATHASQTTDTRCVQCGDVQLGRPGMMCYWCRQQQQQQKQEQAA